MSQDWRGWLMQATDKTNKSSGQAKRAAIGQLPDGDAPTGQSEMPDFAVRVLNRLGFGPRNGIGGSVRSVENLIGYNVAADWTAQSGVTIQSLGADIYRVNFNDTNLGIFIRLLSSEWVGEIVRPRIDIRTDETPGPIRIRDGVFAGAEEAFVDVTNDWQTFTWNGNKTVTSTNGVGLAIRTRNPNGPQTILIRHPNLQRLTGQSPPMLGEDVPEGVSLFTYANGTVVNPDLTVTDQPGEPFTNSVDDFLALGPDDATRLANYVEQQLDWSSINDGEVQTRLNHPNYQDINRTLASLWQLRHVDGEDRDNPFEEMERAVFVRAAYSNRQLLEILADFWHNHFNIFGRDFYAQSVFTSWDRDIIRPPIAGFPRTDIATPQPGNGGVGTYDDAHMLGNFRAMFELSTKHAAMLHYLDNYVNERGSPNENYARELMELHTLGAINYAGPNPGPGDVNVITTPDFPAGINDKYSDADVYELMRFMTGWTVNDGQNGSLDTGTWRFDNTWHDEQQKVLMGISFPAFSGISETYDAIRILAYHPGTADYIGLKLCQRFVADDPPQSLVDLVAAEFYNRRYDSDQLEQVYRFLFNRPEVTDPANWGMKFKRPIETIASAMRGLGTNYTIRPDDSESNSFMSRVDRTGQKPFYWPTPDGHPDDAGFWQGATSLVQTWRAIDYIVDENAGSDNAWTPILQITQAASVADLPNHSPNNLVAFWLKRILGYEPSGGWIGTDTHTKVRIFMQRRPDFDSDPSLWPADTPIPDIDSNNFPYYWHERLRSMVKLICCLPEFMLR